ncbi:MAG: hypothetical protein CM15mP85_21400 [Rhodobacterales bacterium]|nr:MAG: hypothetical protein CM15mP85_21400 [Rhodobacterales bacterium]
MLQEWAQARGQNPPNYEVISRSGPDHAPDFLGKSYIGPQEKHQKAMAGSKRQAEQMAAKALLQKIGEVIH